MLLIWDIGKTFTIEGLFYGFQIKKGLIFGIINALQIFSNVGNIFELVFIFFAYPGELILIIL